MMHAAHHCHQQCVAGVLPAQIVGIGAAQHEREQRAGEADDAAHDDEGLELDAERVVAEAPHALFVVTQRLQQTAERRMRDPPQQRHAECDRGDREDVE